MLSMRQVCLNLPGFTIHGFSSPRDHPDDQARAVWKVEAAPIGTLQTFELERDDITGAWIIKAI